MPEPREPARPEGATTRVSSPPPGAQLGLILLLACAQRALCTAALSALPLFHLPDADAAIYHEWARRFAGGDVGLGREVLRMSPGYFYALGAMYGLLGDGPWPFRIVQELLGLGSIALIWDAARRLYGLRWAACAGALGALYGPLAFFENVQLADGLGAALHAAVLWLAIRVLDRHERGIGPGLGDAACAGIAYGLCAAVRPNALLLVVPLGWAFGRATRFAPRARLRVMVVFALAAGAAIMPIALRNYVVAGEPVLLTSHGGLNVYLGNGPGATGVFRVPDEVADARGPAEQFAAFHREAERAAGRPLSAREADAYWLSRTARAVAADPWRWLQVMGRKLRLYWNGREIWDVYHYDFYRELDPRLAWSLPYSALAALALLGTLLSCVRTRPGERFVAYFNLTTCAAIVLVLVAARYRLAMFGGAVLASTASLRFLVQALRAGDRSRLGLAALALGSCIALTWPVARKRSVFDEEFWKLGAGYLVQRRWGPAEAAYRRSLALNPRHDGSHRDLALLYEHTDRPASAAAHWTWLLGWADQVGDAATAAEARAHLDRLPH
jgi:hypothetical protein